MLLGLQDWQWYGIINKGGFKPNRIAGLQLWLDASDPATLFQDAAKTTPAGNGDVVGAWADKSGQGNDATQITTAQKPTLHTGIINNLPIVRGDATDDNMVISVGVITNETIFIVCKHNVDNAGGTIISSNGPAFKINYNLIANSVRDSYNASNIDLTGGFVGINANIIRTIYDGITQSISVNNGIPVTSTPAALAHTYARIFLQTVGVGVFNGDIAELLIYDSGLSAVNIALVETYLRAKWRTP